jgi:hypothetical protein
MNMLFGEVKDYMDRQVVVIANLKEGQSQKISNARRQEIYIHILVDEIVNKNEDDDAIVFFFFIKLHSANWREFNQTRILVIEGLYKMLEFMMVWIEIVGVEY